MPRVRNERAVQTTEGATKKGSDRFNAHITQALEHFHEPVWLGEHSPLAAPYFLDRYLNGRSDANTVVGRGGALQRALLDAALSLGGSNEPLPGEAIQLKQIMERLRDGSLEQHMLYWGFFEPNRIPITTLIDMLKLKVSRPNYYLRLPKVIQQLADSLLRRINPALRLESPIPSRTLIGRDTTLASCTQALLIGQTVALTGSAGVGKTALATHVLSALSPQPSFWFTVRLGLNDKLGSLLFPLSYFLHSLGAGSAWRQLVADAGIIKIDVVQSLMRHDLASLPPPRPVLCFDEFDLLRPSEVEAHAQILACVESLRGLTPLLLIGQRLAVDVDSQHSLSGLDVTSFETLLKAQAIHLSPDDLDLLYADTGGNPRLLDLFITLHHTGEPLDEALRQMSNTPSLDALLRRIVQRLDPDEQALLMQLAVFRRPAPNDAWDASALHRLIDRHLVQSDGHGGVALLAAFRTAIVNQLDPASREALHREAAGIRATRAEYTAAAFHHVRAGQPGLGLWQWHTHADQEINQGQAGAALELLKQISVNQLSEDEGRILALALSRLEFMVGNYPQAASTLEHASWLPNDVLTALAKRTSGNIADRREELEQAIEAYREGLATIEHLSSEVALFHKNLGWVAQKRLDLKEAWHEAQLVRYEADNLQGYVQEKLGNYDEAQTYYREALALAVRLKHFQGEAKTHNNLARLLALRGDFAAAHKHSEQAGNLFRRIGDFGNLASVQINQALQYIQAGQPHAAIPLAEVALTQFEVLGEPGGIAVAAQNLAEAHQLLGDLVAAQRFAQRVVEAGDPKILPDGLRVLGEVKQAQGDLTEAEKLITQSIQIAEKNQNSYLAAYGWRALGKLYLVQHNLTDAEGALGKAIELFAELELLSEVERTKELLRGGRNGYAEQ